MKADLGVSVIMPNANGWGIYVFPDEVPATRVRYVYRWCPASEKWRSVEALKLQPGCVWRHVFQIPNKHTFLRAQQVKTEHEKRDALLQSSKQKLVEALKKQKLREGS